MSPEALERVQSSEDEDEIRRSVRESYRDIIKPELERDIQEQADNFLNSIADQLNERQKEELDKRIQKQDESVQESINERAKAAKTFSMYVGAVVTVLTVIGGGVAWVVDQTKDSRNQLVEAEQRKAHVDRRLDETKLDVHEVSEDLGDLTEQLDEHVEEQKKINRLDRAENKHQKKMLEVLIKAEGRRVPKKDPELEDAERDLGIFEIEP